MGIVRPGRENWAVVPDGLDCYEFMVSEELIKRTEFFPPAFFAMTNQIERAFIPLVEPIEESDIRHLFQKMPDKDLWTTYK